MNTGTGGSDRDGRWWLDPELARLAFGGDTGPSGTAVRMLVERSIRNAEAEAEPEDADNADDHLVLGDYELLDVLGEGGTGVVYRARQRGLGREVALKLLSAGHDAPAALVDSLRREARHAARLQHPNIVAVHGLGEHEGLLCYAMQLVRGRSLSQWLDAEGPLPQEAAAKLLRTLAEAIHYAHQLGVLHLDLKPGNILIDEQGAPLVADFGLACTVGQGPASGQVAGTPSYMAPEQVQESYGPLVPATDVWALGAILYETLTGHAPFEAATPEETLRLLLDAEVRRPSRYGPISPDLEAICRHCLAKHPGLRYQSARALADDLGRFLEQREVTVRRLSIVERMLRRGRREPYEVMILALLGLLALASGGVLSQQWASQPAACPPAGLTPPAAAATPTADAAAAATR